MANAKPGFDKVKRALAAASLAILATMLSYAGGQENPAKSALLRYLERGRNVEFTAIRLQKSGCDDLGTLQLKVQNNVAGQQCITVLAPIAMQGQIVLDDSNKYVQFFPDENRLVVTKSPNSYLPKPKERIAIAEKNYTFTTTKGPSIAGRTVVYVVATPKDGDMPVRRYGIDEKTSVLLRMETIQRGKQPYVFIDTRAIDFKPNGSLGDLSIRPAGGVRKITMTEPARVSSPSMAVALTGIAPIVPSVLPAGFVARDPEVVGNIKEQFLAVRITDGLALATIYQFNAKGAAGTFPLPPGSVERTIGNIRFAVAGDIPNSMMNKMLLTFTQEYIRVTNTARGGTVRTSVGRDGGSNSRATVQGSGPNGSSTRNSVGGGVRLPNQQSAPPKPPALPKVESTTPGKGGV